MIEKTEFKGKPILILRDDIKQYRKIAIGVFKANLILKNIKAIEEFVKENEQS